MTNIEKVKRILDAGHWVKVTWESGWVYTIISYFRETFCFIDTNIQMFCDSLVFDNCKKIEVIQRIPTAYKAGDKVLVLSNPSPDVVSMENMIWKILEVKDNLSYYYSIFNTDKSDRWNFPAHCLAPAFDEPKEEPTLSGKEAKVVIDGKEYSVTLKLI